MGGRDHRRMATIDRRRNRGARQATAALRRIGDECRAARLAAGLSQVAVGRSFGVSHTHISRIERGLARSASLADLSLVAAAVGLDLNVRVYPARQPLRDAAHLHLLDLLRRRVAAPLRWRTEVPIPIRGDPRAWDAAIELGGTMVGVEAETRLTDVQALTRRLALKQRDAGVRVVILIVAATRSNRTLLRMVDPGFTDAFPLRPRSILGELAAGRLPSSSGMLLLQTTSLTRPSGSRSSPSPFPVP